MGLHTIAKMEVVDLRSRNDKSSILNKIKHQKAVSLLSAVCPVPLVRRAKSQRYTLTGKQTALAVPTGELFKYAFHSHQ